MNIGIKILYIYIRYYSAYSCRYSPLVMIWKINRIQQR